MSMTVLIHVICLDMRFHPIIRKIKNVEKSMPVVWWLRAVGVPLLLSFVEMSPIIALQLSLLTYDLAQFWGPMNVNL